MSFYCLALASAVQIAFASSYVLFFRKRSLRIKLGEIG